MTQRAYGFRLPPLLTTLVLVTAGLVLGATIIVAWVLSDDGSSGGDSATGLPHPLPTQSAPSPAAPVDGSSQPVADPVYPDYGNPSIDVLNYHLALSWSPSQQILTGTATLTIRIVTETDQLALDFSDAYTIDGATLDGQAVPATVAGDDLTVATGQVLTTDTRVTLVVSYQGTPRPGRFPGARADITAVGAEVGADGALTSLSEPYGAYTWFPCNDHPSDKALFDLDIAVPPGWSGVSSGTLTEVTTADDGGRVFHWRGGQPSATYLVALSIDQYQRVDDTGPGGIPVTYWVTEENASTMLPVLRETPAILEWLEARFGEYPFDSCGVVIVPGNTAMETQTMVSMGAVPSAQGERLLAHELAHQWFGDAVTPETWQDLWLNEGFATYVGLLYATDQSGDEQHSSLESMYSQDQKLRDEAGPPGDYDPNSFASSNVYIGPALMLHQLRVDLGDDVFFAMMHDWASHHLHATVSRDDFTEWLTDYTGKDLTSVVDQWLDSTTTPDFPA